MNASNFAKQFIFPLFYNFKKKYKNKVTPPIVGSITL